MKKQIVLLNTHSFVDVITNSSTELFVGDTDKTVEFIKEVLQSFLDSLNKLDDCNYEIDKILTISEIDKDNIEEYAKILMDWKSIPWYMEIEKYNVPDTWDRKYDKLSYEEKYKIRDDYENSWKERNFEKLKEKLIGKIIIEGTEDNSIPYELFDIIEYRLLSRGERIHMG